jgi:hypothetical protein
MHATGVQGVIVSMGIVMLLLFVVSAVSAQDQPSARQREFAGIQLFADQVKEALAKQNFATASRFANELSGRVRGYELALKLAELESQLPSGPSRIYPLQKAARVALEASDYTKAEAYANELLSLSEQYREDPSSGDGVFYGHMVLGQIALVRDRNVQEAKARLAASGKTRGSPVLNSFGPNMSLARDLLAVGERDAVLGFFSQCSTFWKGPVTQSKLRDWTETLKTCCRMPDFADNLVH